MCRSRRELSNEYLLAKIGVDTAENEPLEVWGENSIQYSIVSLAVAQLGVSGTTAENIGVNLFHNDVGNIVNPHRKIARTDLQPHTLLEPPRASTKVCHGEREAQKRDAVSELSLTDALTGWSGANVCKSFRS